MKRTLISALCAFVAVAASAQVTDFTMEDLSSFNSLTVENDFTVRVVDGAAHSVVFSVDEPYKPYVKATVKGSALTITLDEKNIPADVKKAFKSSKVTPTLKAVVTMPIDEMSSIKLSGKSTLELGKDIQTKSLSLDLADQAVLSATSVTCRTATINMDKKSSATLNIACDKLGIALNGSSVLDINQDASSTEVKLSGSSTLTLHGETDNLEMNAKSSSKATIYGSAATASYTTSGTVNINALDLASENTEVDMSGYGTLVESATKQLSVRLSGGATLIYNHAPVIDIENIKSSSMTKYDASMKLK